MEYWSLRYGLDSLVDTGSSVENLALLVAGVREDKKLVNALVRYRKFC